MLDKRQFYIDGQWLSPSNASDLAVINPSTEEVCATISVGNEQHTNQAVAAAKRAFASWSGTTKQQRLEYLREIQRLYQHRSTEMSELISLEMGAPIDLSKQAQTAAGSEHIADFIDTLEAFEFTEKRSIDGESDYIVHEPIGVCALITPWNWPMNQITLKVIAALATGCSMILKPSEISPLSAMLFAEIIDDAGLPKGVFNLVNGDGQGVGSQLCRHPDVDMVSFTGSSRAGKLISKNAADTAKKVCLELGGKGANIIFADADHQAVVRGVEHCFENSGQSCNAPSRMLVERSYYDEAVQLAVAAAKKVGVNQASQPGQHIGPVVSQVQYDRIQALIKAGIDEGGKLAVGGLGKPAGLNKGYFVKPTIFTEVTNDMRIAREEVFGPVLCIIPFDNEQHAIDIANDTDYGLTNYIQTQNKQRAKKIAQKLRSGMVSINNKSFAAASPFGGYKLSGSGREGGVWGLLEFLEVKVVSDWD